MAGKMEQQRTPGVRKILLRGVFWRILFIEGVLLVFSLLVRAVTEDAGAMDLFWYGVRIVALVAVIISFMMISLRRFLTQRIIFPLEQIDRANRALHREIESFHPVLLPGDAPREIQRIAWSREEMLKKILNVSQERLNLIDFIRQTFGKYLSSKVVDEILESPDGLKIGGSRKKVTILMSDLRGFTYVSENRDPHEMVLYLNRYLEKMSEIILKYDGIIDEIIGDAILAVFGAPESHGNDPERAVACAIEMQNSLNLLNRSVESQGFPPMEMGIGINTGDVIVGNIGSELRMKYGIVGATVNEASRIESNTVGGEILMGERTHRYVESIATVTPPKTVMMKGMRSPLVFYGVSAIAGFYNVVLDVVATPGEALSIRLPFQYWQIHDKKVNKTPLIGHTLSITDTHMEVILLPKPALFTNLKLKFQFCREFHCFKDIYAKVVEIKENNNHTVTKLAITTMSPGDREVIQKWTWEFSN
ncbi:Adenylate cyclase, class 3 [Desulfocicer vacuolatum DSM 3385]|uniref:Adenylate cyclase, class 3 n=1 Tax=Desulfocicer vacuolatum DSM 3385 TaxID=1121400 RepID=A0A1W2D004_9BACT|nr:adenylate/guanylate cyclase domain-containing protein [Desulfocicer vacuolatum]SMC90318.1 Adenylate cyclase, class 3 [Desulfocicer vacuolatum DSM 3385]